MDINKKKELLKLIKQYKQLKQSNFDFKQTLEDIIVNLNRHG